MSNEEKKAIEWLKKADWFSARLYSSTILNLIEEQQKEISLLKDQLEYVKSEYEETIEQQQKEIKDLKSTDLTTVYLNGFYDGEKKWKDEIKAKIEEFKLARDTILEHEAEYKRPMMTYDLIRNDYCEKMLQKLLEE